MYDSCELTSLRCVTGPAATRASVVAVIPGTCRGPARVAMSTNAVLKFISAMPSTLLRRGEAGQKRQTRQRLCCLWRLKRCMARAKGSVYTMSEAAWEATMADVSLSDVKSLPLVMRARCKDYVACTESAVRRRVRRGEPCRSIHLIEHDRMCLPVAVNAHACQRCV